VKYLESGDIIELINKKTGEKKYICPKCNSVLEKTEVSTQQLCRTCMILWDISPFSYKNNDKFMNLHLT
jgi:hypothetical protein